MILQAPSTWLRPGSTNYPRIACSAAERSHSRRHEINGSGLRPGRRHADADEHANARENDQPHTAPRSADTAGPLISALPRLETTTEPENRRDPPHIGGPETDR